MSDPLGCHFFVNFVAKVITKHALLWYISAEFNGFAADNYNDLHLTCYLNTSVNRACRGVSNLSEDASGSNHSGSLHESKLLFRNTKHFFISWL